MLDELHNGGRTKLVEAAAATDLVSRAACKAALGIADAGSDGMIDAAIAAAVAELDPAFGGWLGRALVVQKWELQLSSFHAHRLQWRRTCANAIMLPYPPLLNLVSVTYADTAGVDQTLTKDVGFRILGQGSRGKQYIAPLFNGQWPPCRVDDASVRVVYQCGYDGTVNKLPPSIFQAVCLAVRALLSVTERNLFLAEDSVEGVGSQRFIVGAGAGNVVKGAIGQLLGNLQVVAL